MFSDKTSRSSDQRWTLLVRQNQLENARLGMAISKRVLKKAVDRNRIKRIVRESFRCHQQELSGLDIVVMCRNEVKQMANGELFESLSTHWQRIIGKEHNSRA